MGLNPVQLLYIDTNLKEVAYITYLNKIDSVDSDRAKYKLK